MYNEPKFIFGTQYYRAPTPESDCWEKDLKHIKDLGMNSVKFFVQWRWSHRDENSFYFDDLDTLMDIAHKNNLMVTLNLILDVAPLWLYDKYPDAYQITNSGEKILPQESAYRQIGGFPGPCYNHPGALEERKKFLAETVNHFKGHPALSMWDVWNEPEQCSIYRKPYMPTLVCYCPVCQERFQNWLRNKYETIEKLNEVWGRCYQTFEQAEMPKSSRTI